VTFKITFSWSVIKIPKEKILLQCQRVFKSFKNLKREYPMSITKLLLLCLKLKNNSTEKRNSVMKISNRRPWLSSLIQVYPFRVTRMRAHRENSYVNKTNKTTREIAQRHYQVNSYNQINCFPKKAFWTLLPILNLKVWYVMIQNQINNRIILKKIWCRL
jgi:hypothetical protein